MQAGNSVFLKQVSKLWKGTQDAPFPSVGVMNRTEDMLGMVTSSTDPTNQVLVIQVDMVERLPQVSFAHWHFRRHLDLVIFSHNTLQGVINLQNVDSSNWFS
jgi:hypothetical protein